MSAPSVLYDIPGPKAKRRNVAYTALFAAAVIAAGWWILTTMAEKGELNWERWKPFVTDSRVWTEFLIPGLQNTLTAAAIAIVIALPFGALFGIARLSDHKWISVPAGAIVEFFRAIPVLVLMLFSYEFYFAFTDVASEQRPLFAVFTGLVLYNGSVLAEVVRAGILSLPRGQAEAASALGMRKTQIMVFVLLPQAVTAMLPAIVSQLVVILKDTALGGALLGFSDLLYQQRLISANYQNVIATLVIIALIYIAVNFVLTSVAGRLEKRMRRRKRSGGAALTAEMVEDQAPGIHAEPRSGTQGGGV